MHWGWLFIALGLIALGVTIAMVVTFAYVQGQHPRVFCSNERACLAYAMQAI